MELWGWCLVFCELALLSVYCICQSLMNWQQIRWYFNVVKIGAGFPYCSYSFQFYGWIVVRGGHWVLPAGVGMGICEPGLGKTLFLSFSYLLMSLQMLSSAAAALWGGLNVCRETSLFTTFTPSPGTLSNKNVLLGTVLSAPPNDFYSHTVSFLNLLSTS